MPPVLTTFAETVLAIAIFVGLIVWSRAYVADAQSAVKYLDAHYDVARRLMRDPDVPPSVLDFTEGFASVVGRPSLARRFALHLFVGLLSRRPRAEPDRKLDEDLKRLSPEQLHAFVHMVASGMMASAAADPFFSRVYLNLLAAFFSTTGNKDESVSPERASALAVDLTIDARHRPVAA